MKNLEHAKKKTGMCLVEQSLLNWVGAIFDSSILKQLKLAALAAVGITNSNIYLIHHSVCYFNCCLSFITFR